MASAEDRFVHPASSRSYSDSAPAQLCKIVVEANSGLAQQIAEGRTDLMDILPLEKLEGPMDDLGQTLPFLAVYHDKPDMLEYLKKRGVDISAPCDPMNFGNPMFYAIQMKRTRLILTLDILGCSAREPCDSLEVLPMTHAERLDDPFIKEALEYSFGKEERARVLFLKHFLRAKYRKIYLFKLKAIPLLLRCIRGMLGRKVGRFLRSVRDTLRRRRDRKKRVAEKLADGIDLDSDDEDSIIDEDYPDVTIGHWMTSSQAFNGDDL